MAHSIGKTLDSKLAAPIVVLLDLLCILSAISLATMVNWKTTDIANLKVNDPAIATLTIIITLFCFYMFDLYSTSKDFRRFSQLINIAEAVGASFIVITGIAFVDKNLEFGRRLLFAYVFFMFFFSLTARSLYSVLQKRYLYKTGIIISDNPLACLLIDTIGIGEKGIQKLGIMIAGYVSEKIPNSKEDRRKIPFLGTLENMPGILKSRRIDLLIYALDHTANAQANELLIKEKLKGVDLISAVSLYQAITGRVPYEHVNSAWLIEGCLRGNKFTESRVKRLFDILCSAILLALSLPVIAICAVIIKLESVGPAFFVQKRTGKLGKRFRIYKLRTMVRRQTHRKSSDRVTRFGNFMRKYHIDELPQFLNVLKGDMSLVGPRPEMNIFIRRCENSIPFYRLRLAIKPGMTGWAQVWFPHTSTLSDYKIKFEYDLYYLENISLKLDLEILIRTALRIIGYPRYRNSKMPGLSIN